MRVFPNRPLAIVLVSALAANVIVRGIVPASLQTGSDFPNYLTAAKIVADGGSAERLYDTPWFQEQMRRYGIGKPSRGKFSPFPPATALLLLPLASLEPQDALRVLTAVSTLCLIGSIMLLARTLRWSIIDAATLVLLSGSALLSTLRLGQPYALVSAACILGYWACTRRRPYVAGASFGLFTPLKYFPVIFLAYFAWRRRWQVVAAGMATILAVVLVSVAILGWHVHEQFLTSVLGHHLVAQLELQDPFSASFQSFDTLFRRLFVFDVQANPHPLFAAPALETAVLLITKAAIVAATLAVVVRLARTGGTLATPVSLGLLAIVTLLLAPGTGTYHMVLLWLPMGVLVDSLLRAHAPQQAYVLLGCYALIGFFPYGFTAPFEGRGGLTVLAYPRLLLLLTMFVVCLSAVRKILQASRAEEPSLEYDRQ